MSDYDDGFLDALIICTCLEEEKRPEPKPSERPPQPESSGACGFLLGLFIAFGIVLWLLL